jgi:hypothetical protein
MSTNEFHFLKNDTTLRVLPGGTWKIVSGDRAWDLDEIEKFYRVWLLFEYPFEIIAPKLNKMAQFVHSAEPFPFDKLIASALLSRNTNMTNLAMTWVPFLGASHKEALLGLLREVAYSRIGSQRARQIARSFVDRTTRPRS